MSPNPNPLPKRSLNPRAFYFCTRTEQVSSYLAFNFHVQFTNKNVGSLWWSLKPTRHSCVAGASKQGAIKNGRARRYACLSKQDNHQIETNSIWQKIQWSISQKKGYTTEPLMPGNVVIMLIFQLKELIKVKKVKPCRFFFLFFCDNAKKLGRSDDA